jgi:hypothetical protein
MKTRLLICGTASIVISALGLLGGSATPASAASPSHPAGSLPQNPFGHPATGKAPALGAKNAAAGYFWSGGSPSDPYRTYSTSGGTVSVLANTPSTGIYQVSFDGLQSINDTGDVQVSPFGSHDTCPVLGWGAVGSAEVIDVSCYQPGGALDTASQLFDVTITQPHSKPTGVFDFSWVYADTHSSNLTGLGQYNSSHKTNRVRHLGRGRYQITFAGPKSSGTHGTVDVTPFGAGGGNCVLAGWTGSKSGVVVNVNCYSATGKLQNRRFDVLYASTNNVLGLNRDVDANVLFAGRSGITAPTEHYYSSKGAGAFAYESPAGLYAVALPGSGGEYEFLGGDAQVNAVSTHDYHCVIEYWDQNVMPVVNVVCTNSAGALVSTPFVMQWMVPEVLLV